MFLLATRLNFTRYDAYFSANFFCRDNYVDVLFTAIANYRDINIAESQSYCNWYTNKDARRYKKSKGIYIYKSKKRYKVYSQQAINDA